MQAAAHLLPPRASADVVMEMRSYSDGRCCVCVFCTGKEDRFQQTAMQTSELCVLQCQCELIYWNATNNLPLKSKGILCRMFVRAKTEKNTQERAVSWVSAFLAQEKQKKSAHN